MSDIFIAIYFLAVIILLIVAGFFIYRDMIKNTSSNTKSNTWSYVILFLITGLIGAPIAAGIGYIVTKVLKIPTTSFDNYGWRGIGALVILFGVFALLMGTIVIIKGETDSVLGTLLVGILLGVAPIYIGKKLIMNWT